MIIIIIKIKIIIIIIIIIIIKIDRKTRKLLTGTGAHHPNADVDKLYFLRSDGERGRFPAPKTPLKGQFLI